MKRTFRYYNGRDGYCEAIYVDKYHREHKICARIHPEDKEFKSEKIAYDLIDIKASIKELTMLVKEKKKEYKTISNFVTRAVDRYDYDNESSTAKAIRKELHHAEKEYEAVCADLRIAKWIYKEICNTGASLENVLIKLEYAIEKGEID